MIYVHVSNTYRAKLRAGIQRLVVCVGNHLARDPRFRFFAYDHIRQAFFLFSDMADFSRAIYEEDFKRLPFSADDFNCGDVLLEIDAAWGDGIARTELYRVLKARGVIIVGMHYDAVPILFGAYAHPDTVLNYVDCFVDLTAYADYIVCVSQSVETELQGLSLKYNGFRVASRVVPLGSDLKAGSGEEFPVNRNAQTASLARGCRYFLSVGTIEPRKNHALLLRAFERLTEPDAALVLVGRRGWHMQDFIEQLVAHPDYGKRIFWFDDLDDGALLQLYRHCHANVLVSHYEGFGLPAAEGLALGCPTIVSGGGALTEVVGNYGVVVQSEDPHVLANVLEKTLCDPSYYAALKERACSYRPVGWGETAASIVSFAKEIVEGVGFEFDAPLRQAVYLSINPVKLAQSLKSVRDRLPFIERVVVLTTLKQQEAITRVVQECFAESVILCDEHLLEPFERDITDHQRRNLLLRHKLYRQNCIDDNFVAFDDDAFALARTGPEFFVDRGVHQAYYFLTDIGTWAGAFPAETSYDFGLINTWRLLRKLGYGRMAFSSHMPQVINKRLVRLIFDRFVTADHVAAYDEWSLYFNVAMHLYPGRFAAKPYETLGWPMDPFDWLPEIIPTKFQFENRHRPAARVPLSPRDAQTDVESYLAKLRRARVVELGDNTLPVSPLVLTVTSDALSFDCTGRLLAGRNNLRRVLIDDRSTLRASARLSMSVLTQSGKAVRHAEIVLGEARWLPLYPPDEEGLYWLVFKTARGREEIAKLTAEVHFHREQLHQA